MRATEDPRKAPCHAAKAPNKPPHSETRDTDPPSVRPATPGDAVWLSSLDVSQRLKMPLKTLASWAIAGHGPRFARMGRFRRYRLSDLLAWEQDQLDSGGGAPALPRNEE